MKHKKRTALATAASILLINIFPLMPAFADETVSISTVSDFKSFTEKCVYDEYSKNTRFVLENDINLGGEEVKCAEVFCGTFEGGGHSVTNFTLSAEGSNKGLFAIVTKDGQIKDLNVTGEIKVSSDTNTDVRTDLRKRASAILSRIDVTTSDDEQSTDTKGAGGIAGYNAGKIVNCSFGGKIRGKAQVGGIAGTNAMTGVIDSCANGAEIDGDSEVGGLAGYNEGRVKLSKNEGKICPDADENTVNVGGITGNSEGAVFACTNDGAVGSESFGDNVGGISGKQSGEIRECVNNGTVLGRRSVGGVCGRFEPYTDIDLSYESAKAAVDKQIDIFRDDVEDARQKIVDLVDELTDGRGIISDILDRLGIKEGSTGDRLDRITNSSTRMMDSVTNSLNRVSDENLSGSVKDALDSISDFSTETTETLRNTGNSIDNTLSSVDDFLGEFDGKGREISETLDNLNNSLANVDSSLDNLNDAVDKGSDDVDELKDKLFTQLDDLDEMLDDIDDNLNSTHTDLQRTMSSLRGTSSSAWTLFDDLDDSVNSAQKDINKLRTTIDNIRKNIEKRVEDAKKLIPSTNPIVLPSVLPTIMPYSEYEVEPDAVIESEYEVEPSVVGFITDMLTVTAHAANDDDNKEKSAFSEIKSTDITLPRLIGDESADTALIRYCINNGDVTGHELSGGVAGSMGFESAVRNGESITLPDGTRVNADSVLKAVIDGCISYGAVTAKTDYAGGVVGKCDIGDIKNTLTTGEIKSEEGSYAGGIAGLCSGDIENSIAVNDVEGKSYIGGIAGSGKNIKTSYALPRLDGTKEYSGAIAGFLSGEAEGTYFIDEGLSGINGANYEGKAEAVAPSEIAASDGVVPAKMKALTTDSFYMAQGDLFMPQIKTLAENNAEQIAALLQSKSAEMSRFHFNVVFMDKDKELKAFAVEYGTVLASGDIPRLSADGTEVPVWDKDVKEPIIRHTKFTAVYNKAATTLSSGEEPPVLLVESVFDEGASVILKEADVTHEFDGYKVAGGYSFELSKNAYDRIKVHIRDEKGKAKKIAVQENGKWTVIDCEMDGSYAVFEVGAPCTFAVLYAKGNPLGIILAAAGALLVIAAGVVLFVVLRRRHGREKEKDI